MYYSFLMFNYVIFHNLILASQMQFSFVLMHILTAAGVIENAQACYSVCLVRYTQEILLG